MLSLTRLTHPLNSNIMSGLPGLHGNYFHIHGHLEEES